MGKFLAIFIIISVFPATAMSQMSPRDRYLDPSFEKGTNNIPGDKKNSARKAFKLLDEGIKLYKLKNNQDAIAKYEEALELYAAPDIYYHYGNSLSNIGELLYSVRAYEYAIQYYCSSPELAWFNMACSLSRMLKTDKTYTALTNAILAGYPSIENVRADSDLAFIRTDSRWNARFAELKKIFERGTHPLPSGKKLRLGIASTEDFYSFCPDGKVKVEHTISEFKNHKQYGTWKFNNYVLIIMWNKETGSKGIGKPVMCAAVCEYKNYTPFSTTINRKETILWQEVESSENGPWKIMPLTGPCE